MTGLDSAITDVQTVPQIPTSITTHFFFYSSLSTIQPSSPASSPIWCLPGSRWLSAEMPRHAHLCGVDFQTPSAVPAALSDGLEKRIKVAKVILDAFASSS